MGPRLAATLACGALLAGCYSEPQGTGAMTAADLDADAFEVEALSMPPDQSAADAQRVTRSGAVRIEVDALDMAMAATAELAARIGGFVADSDWREGPEGSRSGSVTLRVPSDSLQAAVDELSELGRVLSVSIQARDVTLQYVDLETRLAVKRETVDRLRSLVDRSGDLEDLLAVERELDRATAELEGLEGRMRVLQGRLALAELRVGLVEPGLLVSSGAFRPVLQAVRASAETFARSLAALVYLIVFLLPWVVLALLAWPFLRRGLARRRASDPPRGDRADGGDRGA